jgi:hypothetical protein
VVEFNAVGGTFILSAFVHLRPVYRFVIYAIYCSLNVIWRKQICRLRKTAVFWRKRAVLWGEVMLNFAVWWPWILFYLPRVFAVRIRATFWKSHVVSLRVWRPAKLIRFVSCVKVIHLLLSVQTGSGIHPIHGILAYIFHSVNWPERDADYVPPSSVEVNKTDNVLIT